MISSSPLTSCTVLENLSTCVPWLSLYDSGPQLFWHQRPVSWIGPVFHGLGRGDGFVHHLDSSHALFTVGFHVAQFLIGHGPVLLCSPGGLGTLAVWYKRVRCIWCTKSPGQGSILTCRKPSRRQSPFLVWCCNTISLLSSDLNSFPF